MGLRKTNTLGIAQANKIMHFAMAYHCKNYLKFVQNWQKSMQKHLAFC
jgi:hypothetical protein